MDTRPLVVIFGSPESAFALYGYGYGSGYGSGSGSGSGSGYGDGDGYGSGYGSGSGYWFHRFKEFLDLPRVRALLDDPAVSFGYWRSDKKGRPSNHDHDSKCGPNCTPVSAGVVQEIPGPLEICTRRALHATLNPEKWQGERLWLVALFGEVQTSDDKLGALKREILAEVQV
jgi:hypothetical protein